MKIQLVDDGSGIALPFAQAIGASVQGRFIHIPPGKGGGYITGFRWGDDLRMMIRYYYLNETIRIERTNLLREGQDEVVFRLSGLFPAPFQAPKKLSMEPATILICQHAVSFLMEMPSDVVFSSVTIAISKAYLQQLFGQVEHPVVASVLGADGTFVLETGLSGPILQLADALLQPSVPESLASHYYKLKCEELLCHTISLLMQREHLPLSRMHAADIKAIYTVKTYLQSTLSHPPHIAALAKSAGMSQPKLRKLFKQTFGEGIFAYYQSLRMQEAARLLTQKSLTVSEVGYGLGFTNLSHFSRVFEAYAGVKPKQYSMR